MSRPEPVTPRTALLVAAATATVTLAGVFTLAGLLGFTRPAAPPPSAPSRPVLEEQAPSALAETQAPTFHDDDDDDDDDESHEEHEHGHKGGHHDDD